MSNMDYKDYKKFEELSDEEKGALLLAHHNKKNIEFYSYVNGWWPCGKDLLWVPEWCYRVAEVKKNSLEIKAGDFVHVNTSDWFNSHLFKVVEVFEDCVGGYSMSGNFEGEYGELAFEYIGKIVYRQIDNN